MANEYRNTNTYLEVVGAVVSPFEITNAYLEVVGIVDSITKATNVYLEVVVFEPPMSGSSPAQRMFIIS